ncbi:two-component response regulator DpiA [Serratia proteamaculans]|uniref:Transcriptional regulatory protein n=1 Tax=Serratia proteamaculans TaxID=28151 RepID=A0A5Q2VHS3_SERPR|nr:two-component response regulator DpiA [Serratia proteamaculans]QGH62963.1 two-component response regulator DpiA [Serratia proteamaculans]
MEWLNILIVEDETPLAEMHAEFIRQNGGCRQIWLAGNLAQARMMTDRFKPDLILLDNFLPDGQGIELLRELTLSGYAGGIVFITAASDMDTVAEALRYGVFDYLIKPLAYDRLAHTLLRFSQRRQALKDKARLSQQRIDQMFNTYARGEQQAALPAGIDELTLVKIRALFELPSASHTAESVAQKMGLSRTTARRYLEFCTAAQQLRAEIIYGKVGRPQRIYRPSLPE